MNNSFSKWRVAAFEDDLSSDNALLSGEQEDAKHQIFQRLEQINDAAGEPLDTKAIAGVIQSMTGKDDAEALKLAVEYERNPMHNEFESQQMEPQIENELTQEQVTTPDATATLDSTVPSNAPMPGQMMAKYPGHHGEGKPGDKKHLKGEGPVNEKANEIYHAIMREKGGESAEDKASAAAIAWDTAKDFVKKKKKKEKKAFFRGEETEVLDSYRDMWGTNLSRVRIGEEIIEIPSESLRFKSVRADSSDVEDLIKFVEKMPNKTKTAADITARINNLRIAMDEARSMLLDPENYSHGEQTALHSIYTRCANELSELDDFDNFVTEEDLARVVELPDFEIGKEVFVSSFSQHSTDWDAATETEIIDDIDKFVREDPILMVAELPETLMSDASAVRTHARARVTTATAYVSGDIRNDVIKKYIDNAERARRVAFQIAKNRNSQTVQEKTESANAVPDEGMFL